MTGYHFSIFVWIAVLLRILLAYHCTLGLGYYMHCVHVKASKPSPPQSWSDCTIILLTLSFTTGYRASILPGSWLLTSRSTGPCSARQGRTKSKFVSLLLCTLDHLGGNTVAHHQFRESFSDYFQRKTNPKYTWSNCIVHCPWAPWWHIASSQTHTHPNSEPDIYIQTYDTSANFKGDIKDLEPWNTVREEPIHLSPLQFFTLTYHYCITFQSYTEVCCQRAADTSKGCGKSTPLLGSSQLCHCCSGVGLRDAMRLLAWLRTFADLLRLLYFSSFDDLKLFGRSIGRGFLVQCGLVYFES